jgi:magnesium transporter
VIRSRVYCDGQLEEEGSFDPAELEKVRQDGRHRLWIDVVDPSDEELSTLQRLLDLHELSVEDSRRWGQRAKVEFYPGYVFVVLHALSLDANDELIDSEVHIFADENLYLLTIRRAPLFTFDAAIDRARATSDLSGEGIGYPSAFVLYRVFRRRDWL